MPTVFAFVTLEKLVRQGRISLFTVGGTLQLNYNLRPASPCVSVCASLSPPTRQTLCVILRSPLKKIQEKVKWVHEKVYRFSAPCKICFRKESPFIYFLYIFFGASLNGYLILRYLLMFCFDGSDKKKSYFRMRVVLACEPRLKNCVAASHAPSRGIPAF